MKWAYLTHDGFVFGRGRAISSVVVDVAWSSHTRQQAAAIYETRAYFRQFSDKAEFVPALAAALATRDAYSDERHSFANMQELVAAFGGAQMAGAPGFEPGTYGFGDRRSTN